MASTDRHADAERLGIGDSARASGLTPKALRLYDELGLLCPAEVDPVTGYRSYDPEQLDRARLVARLRLVGMPLARIGQVAEAAGRGDALAAAAEVTSYWRQVEADTGSSGRPGHRGRVGRRNAAAVVTAVVAAGAEDNYSVLVVDVPAATTCTWMQLCRPLLSRDDSCERHRRVRLVQPRGRVTPRRG